MCPVLLPHADVSSVIIRDWIGDGNQEASHAPIPLPPSPLASASNRVDAASNSTQDGARHSVMHPLQESARAVEVPSTPLEHQVRKSPVQMEAKRKDETIENMRIDANSAVLTGFDPNAKHGRLRYGDSISIIPNGLNALVAGTRYGRAWVEVLEEDVAVPPNLRDCQWRLLPPRQFVEKKKLRKHLKEGKWNEGRSDVPRPSIPSQLDDLSTLAASFCSTHGLKRRETKQVVENLLLVLKMEEEEREGNESDLKRQLGSELRYGSSVILEHEASGLMLGITKLPSTSEPACLQVELADEANERSIFRIMPAIKVMAEGSPVTSGDFIALHTVAPMDGSRYHLHMSQEERQERTVIDRKLALHDTFINGIAEINASQVDGANQTCFRVLLYQRFELKNKDASTLLKGEDVICFYHKQNEAFLEFDPFGSHGDVTDATYKWNPFYLETAPPPGFYESQRLDSSSRKKIHWVWKVESECINLAGDKIAADGSKFYRIKHIPSNLYLMRKADELACTRDLRDERTLFTFQHFWRDADPEEISTSHPVFITSKDGKYLCAGGDHRSTRHKKAQFLRCDMQPDAHAIMVLRLSDREITPLIRLRRSVRVLQIWESTLQSIPEVHPDQIPSGHEGIGPAKLPEPTQRVLNAVMHSHDEIMKALEMMVLSCSIDHDPLTRDKPLAKDGVPNRYVQKVFRELGVIPLVMHLLEDPFRRGVSPNWLLKDERFFELRKTMNLMYRLLKQLVRSNHRNSSALFG